jgi:hypothetical protein
MECLLYFIVESMEGMEGVEGVEGSVIGTKLPAD